MRTGWILWPSFLVAAVLEMFFFALVDPHDLTIMGRQVDEWNPLALYTLGFFFFWVFTAASSGLTVVLQLRSDEINRYCPLPPRGRPEGCPKRETDDEGAAETPALDEECGDCVSKSGS